MACFKNIRTGNILNVKSKETIDIMRNHDPHNQYLEVDKNGNPIPEKLTSEETISK